MSLGKGVVNMVIGFGWDDFSLMIKLDTISDFTLLFENTNQMYKRHFDDLVQLAESIEDDETKQEYYDYNIDSFILYRDTLPRISKYGILMNLWAHLEYSVLELANEAITKLGIDAKVKGLGLEDYLNFINENVDGELLCSENQDKAEVLRVIRNRIMHSNGIVDRESRAIQHVNAIEYVETNDLLTFSEKDQIIVSDDLDRLHLVGQSN